jgi:hypothetical protein
MLGLHDLPPEIAAHIKVDANGCWLWQRATAKGYGTGFLLGRQVTIHLVVYRILVDLVPPGMVLDHSCRIKRCCNPSHLEPVTQLENVRRAGELMYAEAGT